MKFELMWKSYTDKTRNRTTPDKDGWFMLWLGIKYVWTSNLNNLIVYESETHKRLWKYYR